MIVSSLRSKLRPTYLSVFVLVTYFPKDTLVLSPIADETCKNREDAPVTRMGERISRAHGSEQSTDRSRWNSTDTIFPIEALLFFSGAAGLV